MSGGAIPASMCTLSKFVGLRQPEMIRQQSCRAGFSLRACVDLAHTLSVRPARKLGRATFHKITIFQIYEIIRLPWLHSKELLIISHLTFFSYKEDMLQIW